MSLQEYLPVQIAMDDEEKQKRIEDFHPYVEKIIKCAADPNWKSLKKKQGYEVFWMRSDESPLVYVKGEGVVEASVQELFEFLQDFDKTTSIDPMYKEGKIVLDLGGKHTINYAAFYMGPLISCRDFVMHGYDGVGESGIGVSVGKSIDLDALPERGGYVRAIINASGYVYRALPEDPSKCFVQYVVNVDPKGWLPYWLVNLAASDQGTNIKRLQEYFAKEKKPKKEKKDKKDKMKKYDKPHEEGMEEGKDGEKQVDN